MLKETLKRKLGGQTLSGQSIEPNMIDFLLCNLHEDDYSKFSIALSDPGFLQIVSNQGLKNSIEAFFENNLNVCETSAKTFLHRNTLNYRLDKIERLTGFDLRKFDDAVTFKILMQMHERYLK